MASSCVTTSRIGAQLVTRRDAASRKLSDSFQSPSHVTPLLRFSSREINHVSATRSLVRCRARDSHHDVGLIAAPVSTKPNPLEHNAARTQVATTGADFALCESEVESKPGRLSKFWSSERAKVVAMVAVAMALCNADRVVMSVAIVPMSAAHGWSQSFAGVVQVRISPSEHHPN
jgi:hypothetical protein